MSYLIGIPKETLVGERRVAATPDSVKRLVELGLGVQVERGAGAGANAPDAAYAAAGAALVDAHTVWATSDTVFKVRPPSLDEARALREGALLVALVQPWANPGLLEALAARGASVLALEKIPRVTRAQKMDVLSSQANLAGYRAVIEAATAFQGFFGPQVTAAGSSPPARVLVIGCGVAGLAAAGAARALGAEVRAFDTRAAAREQVETMGATFLEVSLHESGEGQGGYAKTMSPEFIAAEMALFRAQAAEVDVVITTALVPGTRAPLLLPRDVVAHLKPGSVVVDLAAEQGGNCELCRPGEAFVHEGVTIIGFTDLPSRMASVASRFFAMNVVHLARELVRDAALVLDLDDDVVRPAVLCHRGELLPPPPAKAAPPSAQATTPSGPGPVAQATAHGAHPTPKHGPATEPPVSMPPVVPEPSKGRAWATGAGLVLVLALLGVGGRFAPAPLMQHLTVFVLACFVGWQIIWSVTPALHTPLMSVTNAISGIIIVGGLLQVGGDVDAATILGLLAVLFAAINIAGGFLVTHRMLKMFHRGQS